MEETLKDMLIGAWVLVMIGLSFLLVSSESDEDMGANSIILVLIIVTTIGITKYFS